MAPAEPERAIAALAMVLREKGSRTLCRACDATHSAGRRSGCLKWDTPSLRTSAHDVSAAGILTRYFGPLCLKLKQAVTIFHLRSR
jgi:hypothetical protein